MPGFFKPGNTYGKGRPRKKLSKPERLLPVVFERANINWQRDLTVLYRKLKAGNITSDEKTHLRLLMELLPYMAMKAGAKESDTPKKLPTPETKPYSQSVSDLLKQLEDEQNGAKPGTSSESGS